MESNTAETFDVDEFQQIIVNTFQNDWLHNSKEKSDEEESKHKDDQQNPLEKESETHQTWKMYSIKDITPK